MRSSDDNEKLAYYALIQKAVKQKVKSTDHIGFREDVVNAAFIKIVKSNFFIENQVGDADKEKIIARYIWLAVSSCYLDQLAANGIVRRRTSKERSNADEEKSYETIESEIIEDEPLASNSLNSEQLLQAQQAYQYIKNCYDSAIAGIDLASRRDFLNAAFWDFDKYDATIKNLAVILGYSSSNPTQELNRFVGKVALCTAPHGIKLTGTEQVRFLAEIIT